jgi:hypothetical protein
MRQPKDSTNDKSATVSCSMRLPRSIWRAAKIQALDENRDFQALVADALTEYLKRHQAKEGTNVK